MNDALNYKKIVEGVMAEPIYEDDDYKYIDHRNIIYDGI